MGTITKRGDLQWQAKVRRKGFPSQSRTFMYKEDAEKWVRALERELETSGFIDRRSAEKNTFAEILKRYQNEITAKKKSGAIERVKIDVLLRDTAFSGLRMTAITSEAIAKWRDRRLEEVSSGTVNREMDVISAVLNHARREWGIHVENPIPYVKRPAKSRARDRRLSNDEEKYLRAALTTGERRPDGTFEKTARNPWLAPVFELALETAMRRGELLSLSWENIDLGKRTAFLPDTKNGDARMVPLSTKATKTIKALKKIQKGKSTCDGQMFDLSAMALRKGFTRAVERAQVQYLADCVEAKKEPVKGFLVGVRFHDLRHEATSRLAEKLSNILELSAVTGHRDIRMLKRYYHPRAEDIAKKLG
ncbi:MAG: site-specific integrase [Burkholderiales bacterium]|jgi:integrase|nr:site-specific integrase [Burkholderiales bacterium]